jgi:hypothetical protein
MVRRWLLIGICTYGSTEQIYPPSHDLKILTAKITENNNANFDCICTSRLFYFLISDKIRVRK